MKASILQENLQKALSAVSRIIPTRAQLPILQNVLLRTQEKSLAEQKGITLKESKEVETATQSASSAIEKREDALTTSILAKQENVIRTIFDSLKKYSPEDAKIWTIIKIILEKDKNVLDNIVALQENIKTAEGQLQNNFPVSSCW